MGEPSAGCSGDAEEVGGWGSTVSQAPRSCRLFFETMLGMNAVPSERQGGPKGWQRPNSRSSPTGGPVHAGFSWLNLTGVRGSLEMLMLTSSLLSGCSGLGRGCGRHRTGSQRLLTSCLRQCPCACNSCREPVLSLAREAT